VKSASVTTAVVNDETIDEMHYDESTCNISDMINDESTAEIHYGKTYYEYIKLINM